MCWQRCVGSIASAVRCTKDVPWCRAALAEAVGKAAACFSVGMKPKQSTSSTENSRRRSFHLLLESWPPVQCNPIQCSSSTENSLSQLQLVTRPPWTRPLLLLHSLTLTTIPLYSSSHIPHPSPVQSAPPSPQARPHRPFPLPPLSPSPGPVPSALRNRLLRCFVCDPPPPPGHDGLFIPALQA